MSQNVKTLQFNGRTFHILGTAHVSTESVKEVRRSIEDYKPDRVCVELDEGRYQTMTQHDSWEKLDLVQVFRQKKGFLLMANLVLGSYQRRIGAGIGVNPGAEMKEALEAAQEMGIPTSLIDRDVRVTLGRAWKKAGLWGKAKIMAALLSSAFSEEEVTEEQIEELKNNSELDQMMQDMSKEFPKVKEILIDERDRYLATKLWESEGQNILAVVGAGHVPGMLRCLDELASEKLSTDIEDISHVPPKSRFAHIIPWIIPALILGLFALAFHYSVSQGFEAFGSWVFWNLGFTLVGGVIALGHPLTILVAAIMAPITSVNPFVGVGMISGPLEVVLRKPRVEDFETLKEDSQGFRSYYKNRILRSLLVFAFTSLGSVIGSFVAGSQIISQVIGFFQSLGN